MSIFVLLINRRDQKAAPMTARARRAVQRIVLKRENAYSVLPNTAINRRGGARVCPFLRDEIDSFRVLPASSDPNPRAAIRAANAVVGVIVGLFPLWEMSPGGFHNTPQS